MLDIRIIVALAKGISNRLRIIIYPRHLLSRSSQSLLSLPAQPGIIISKVNGQIIEGISLFIISISESFSFQAIPVTPF